MSWVLATREESLAGPRTFTKKPSDKSETGDGDYTEQGLPSPPWTNEKQVGVPHSVVPGESGSGADGRSVHEDKARTQSLPGEQSPHPVEPARTMPGTRPGLAASKTALTLHQRPIRRKHKQRGSAKLHSRQNYRKHRSQSRTQAKQRYRKMRRNPVFKKQQAIRHKHPERFKMRIGAVLTAPEIAFVAGRDLNLGYVRSVSGLTESVSFHVRLENTGATVFRSVPVNTFLEGVVFLSDEDIDAMFLLLDTEIGEDDYDPDSAESLTHDGESLSEDVSDMERYVYGMVNAHPESTERIARRYVADFLYEKRPPDMSPEVVTDRAHGHGIQDSGKGPRPSEGLEYRTEITRSNPGSRVFVTDADHVEKWARTDLRDVPVEKRRTLYELVKSPMWGKFEQGRVDEDTVLEWLRRHGWGALTLPGLHDVLDTAFHTRTAVRMSEIRKQCDPALVKRSVGVRPVLRRVDAANGKWLFDVPGSEGSYRVRLEISKEDGLVDVQKMDVKVSCSCPFWRWQGPEHWSKQDGYLSGKPSGTASRPTEKDPQGRNRACKHVLAVFAMTKTWRFPKARDDDEVPGKTARFSSDAFHMERLVRRYLSKRGSVCRPVRS